MDIQIINHQTDLNKNIPEKDCSDIRRELENSIENCITNNKTRAVTLAYFDGVKETNIVGNEQSMYILLNATKIEGDIIKHDKFGKVLASDSSAVPIALDDVVVANYFRESGNCNMLNILIDTIALNDNNETFEKILRKVNDYIDNLDSWNEDNKAEIMRRVKGTIDNYVSTQLNRTKDEMESAQRYIDDYRESIVRYTRQLNAAIMKYESLKSGETNIDERVEKDFDLIVNHEKIQNLKVEDGWIIFKTVHLNFFDENDNEYQGGEYTVKIQMFNGEIKIYSSHTVRGGWSDNDPHPHVSGNSNRPCLGNITSTVAELTGQHEYYALVLMLINYLEAVDTTDPVGRYAYCWGRIIDGEVVYEEPELKVVCTCENCGDPIYEDEESYYPAYIEAEYDECDEVEEVMGDPITICEACRESDFFYSDNVDAYVVY